jgi:hypothetical protein
MTIYAVFKQGVYRHECGGVFSTMEMAYAVARQLLAAECDHYHTYEVTPFELDEATPRGSAGYKGGVALLESDPLLSLTRAAAPNP